LHGGTQDINFDGQIGASLQGFNDWAHIDLRQTGARAAISGLAAV
jgi:hypothetical protein